MIRQRNAAMKLTATMDFLFKMQAMFFLYPSYQGAAGVYFVSSSSSVRQEAGRAAELLEPTFL